VPGSTPPSPPPSPPPLPPPRAPSPLLRPRRPLPRRNDCTQSRTAHYHGQRLQNGHGQRQHTANDGTPGPGQRLHTADSDPFSLVSTRLPPSLNNDADKFANLFNQLYEVGVGAEFGSPLFGYFAPHGVNTTEYLLAYVLTGPDQWPFSMANFQDVSRMSILATQFGLTLRPRVCTHLLHLHMLHLQLRGHG
jgi:hypothetical protein